ncbi:hypothetical protein ACIPVK_10160 [Paeniglutamicibacter sp. MACA_103]|uniref:hypothetical protein n=1 Tax=Paeniglutamicibacter sp. MACA_103 TaxID=3377337 RepID=UPI003896244F
MSQSVPTPLREAASAPRAGHTRVSAQALTATARAVAANVFGVDPGLVRAFLRDDAGYLALTVHLPLPLAGPAASAGPTVLDRVRSQRGEIGKQFSELTGSLVSRVDVRVTGIVDSAADRRR